MDGAPHDCRPGLRCQWGSHVILKGTASRGNDGFFEEMDRAQLPFEGAPLVIRWRPGQFPTKSLAYVLYIIKMHFGCQIAKKDNAHPPHHH